MSLSCCQVVPTRGLLTLTLPQVNNRTSLQQILILKDRHSFGLLRPGSKTYHMLTLRIGNPADTLSAIALAPAGRTRQSPKLITWMLRRCFRACENTHTFLEHVKLIVMNSFFKESLHLRGRNDPLWYHAKTFKLISSSDICLKKKTFQEN